MFTFSFSSFLGTFRSGTLRSSPRWNAKTSKLNMYPTSAGFMQRLCRRLRTWVRCRFVCPLSLCPSLRLLSYLLLYVVFCIAMLVFYLRLPILIYLTAKCNQKYAFYPFRVCHQTASMDKTPNARMSSHALIRVTTCKTP